MFTTTKSPRHELGLVPILFCTYLKIGKINGVGLEVL